MILKVGYFVIKGQYLLQFTSNGFTAKTLESSKLENLKASPINICTFPKNRNTVFDSYLFY